MDPSREITKKNGVLHRTKYIGQIVKKHILCSLLAIALVSSTLLLNIALPHFFSSFQKTNLK